MTLLFLRSSAVAELYAASDDGNPPPPGTVTRWFLLPQGATAPASLDLAATWALTGTYLFLEAPLPAGGEAAFARAAWAFLVEPAFRAPRIAWFPSGVPVTMGETPNPPAQPGGALDGYVLSVSPNDPSITGRALVISYRNYALVVGLRTPLGLDAAAQAFTLTQTTALPIVITTDLGATTLGGASSITVPLTGPDAGSLQLVLSLGQTDGVSDLTHLDVGLRAYYTTPGSSTDGGVSTLVTSLQHPVFDPGQTPTLRASFAPWSVAEARTYFLFADSGKAIVSCYATVTGYRALLAPYGDTTGPSGTPARLVLATRPTALPPSPDDFYTIVPKGDFALSIDGPGEAAKPIAAASPRLVATPPNSRLMCGLSGVEYVGLGGAGALSFFTGSPAYAAGFDPMASVQAPTTLTTDATTAWALPSAHASPALTYYAQPDGAVLYQPSSGSDFEPLVYLEVAANALPSAVAAASAVPFFAYAGVPADDPDLDAYRMLESKVLSPSRRALIAKAGGPPPPAAQDPRFVAARAGDDGFSGVTPQGLLAIFADATLQTMDELVLAQMPGGSRLSLHDLPNGTPLRTAIASNQLFLVASNPAAMKPHLSPDPTKNLIVIDGWTFDLDPSTWATTGPPGLQGTTLVFKFAAGRLVDLAKDTGAWAKAGGDADPFNVDDEATSSRIGTLIQQAIAAYDGGKGEVELATFVAAVTDPGWQGILILNAETPLTALPDACKGLAAGIDPALFHAHHVGINTAKIATTTSPISIEASSMFALIHYQAPRVPVTPNGAAYQFQVDLLEVLFEASLVTAFSSKIELLVAQLFGSPVDLPPPDRILYLYGVLQRQTIAGKVYETYLFRTAQNQPRVFPIAKGSVLQQVQIGSAQFVTQLDTGDGLTHTYFALAGLLDFAELDGLDLFSFGGETPSDTAGLSYSKLLVRMVFDPAVQNSSVFVFDANGIAFDPAGSTARGDSLYQHFPITLSAFIQADTVSSPGGMGYLGVQSPLTQSALSYPWFGLVFDLDLGSLGALAAKAGFTAKLLAAWSPSSSANQVFLGLKLPGSDGGKGTISIEGVLDLGFRALVLGRDGPSTYYLLLNALALKFLSLTFPTGGQVDMALFGNPEDEHNSSLGWYAAYTKDQAQKPSGAKDRAAHAALRATRAGRRAL